MPTEILQEIGSYAGLAAIVGLAVLSALYFSQARDVKRLREWAGRAPERSVQPQAPVPPATQAGRVVAQPQQPRQIPVPGRAAASAAGAAPATAVGASQATEEHDALAEGEERELVEAGAGSDNGDTGEHDALYDETGEHDELYDSEDGDTGDSELVEGGEGVPAGEETGESDAIGDEHEDFDEDGERVGAEAGDDGFGEDVERVAAEGDDDFSEDGEDDAADGDRFAPPEGEPAVAAGEGSEASSEEDEEEEGAEDEAGEREPVGVQARAQEGPTARAGLAPSTPAGGAASAPPSAPGPGLGGNSGQGTARPAPPLPGRPMPSRSGGTPPPLPGRRLGGGAGDRPSQTAIIPPPARAPWYRRLARQPRYLVLVIAGILIVGGGAAFGVTQLTKEDTGTGGGTPAASDGGTANDDSGSGDGGGGDKAKAAPVDAKSVTVAVLNGTTVPGLAAQMGDKISGFGFQLGNITNSTDQDEGRAESVVLYAPGHQREAVAVGRKLNIDQREQVDAETQALAGDATVVVITGIDQTR